jgi:hypothetical protein
MRSAWIGVALLVAACSSKPAELPDAAVDAYDCAPPAPPTQVRVTGASPLGALDTYRYANVGYASGFCPESYVIDITPDGVGPQCATRELQLAVLQPFASTGSNAVAVTQYGDQRTASTMNVTFEATQLDQPDASPAHIIGHFVSHDLAWSLDLAVDLTSQYSNDCPP